MFCIFVFVFAGRNHTFNAHVSCQFEMIQPIHHATARTLLRRVIAIHHEQTNTYESDILSDYSYCLPPNSPPI